jgi:integrase
VKLTEAQVLRLISVADMQMEKPLILVLLHTLARVDEILRLEWKDVDFKLREVTRWTRKRKGGRYEPIKIDMNRDLYDVLIKLWNERTQEKWVFYNKKTGTRYNHRPKFMRSICNRAGINPHVGFHALRHFMASLLADMGISKKIISKLLGHKSMQTTEIYLHSIDESQKDAVKVIEGKFMLADNACGNDES